MAIISNTFTSNIYRYSILALVMFLVLLVASHGDRSIMQFILTVFLLILIVILFEIFTAPKDVKVTVEKMTTAEMEEQFPDQFISEDELDLLMHDDPQDNYNDLVDNYNGLEDNYNDLELINYNNLEEENIINPNNVESPRGQTFLNQNNVEERQIIIASNENNNDVPYDPRSIMIKKNNKVAPVDINYDAPSNFMPNDLGINEDKYDYLYRGHIYDDQPGSANSIDNLIINPKFGQQGYFIENGCNFGMSH